ncbi:hypothetical protein [Arthrobacter sp. A2-55]|uniref:hypothetical protein n=1 Tax=Arthrobacter sp. A2-55 TaxID=2897337 RepID=UPI0021CD5E78|nr:hypothetical protein [Arthrobacter sp. A2-55]MCU6480151.1 hypothetical protein [Arthrobacter sp. A2-55]
MRRLSELTWRNREGAALEEAQKSGAPDGSDEQDHYGDAPESSSFHPSLAAA